MSVLMKALLGRVGLFLLRYGFRREKAPRSMALWKGAKKGRKPTGKMKPFGTSLLVKTDWGSSRI